MAIGATVVMDRHRVVGQMALSHAGRGVEGDAASRRRVIDRVVIFGRLLVVVTVEAVDGAGQIAGDDVLHRGANREIGVDVSGRIMTGGAVVIVGLEDVDPVLDRVTGGAELGVNLAQVKGAKRHLMVDRAAGGAVVMAGKVGGVTVYALSSLAKCRTRAGAGG